MLNMIFADKYIFIKIPKTGSSAIEQFLLREDSSANLNMIPDENGGWKEVGAHITAHELRSRLGNEYSSRTVFAFLRDPEGRALSAYRHYRFGRSDIPTPLLREIRRRPGVALRIIFAR